MKKFTFLTAFLLCTVWLTYGQWTYTNLSEPKAYMGAVVLGSKAYFAGGMNSSGLKSTVEIYDAVTGEWNTTQNLSVARAVPLATACGSKVLFAGGADFYGSGAVYSTVDIFDTITQQWSVEQLSVPRLGAAVVSHGNKVLFAGGSSIQQSITYDIVDIYDVQTGEWSTATLSEPRVTWYAVVGDLAVFAGGWDFPGIVSKRVDIYNFTTDTWSIDSLSVARAFVGVASIGNKVMFAGGVTSENESSDVVDIYDATTGTWVTTTLSQSRAFCDNQNVVTAGDKVFFVGGGDIDLYSYTWYNAYTVIDIYDPVTNTWSVNYMPFSARIHHAVVSFGEKFMIAGGIDGNGFQSLSAIYTCPPTSCLPEGITFATQEQIDNFQTNYPGCNEIEGDVTIFDNWSGSITNLNGLDILTSIGGFLDIANNNALTNLSGLQNLYSIGGNLNISNNDALTNLSGLENLTTIGGNIWVYQNEVLISIVGLQNLTSINDALVIGHNPSLSTCGELWLCNYLDNPNSSIMINDNAWGCNSVIEVANSCGNSLPCLPYGHYYFVSQSDIDNFQQVFPNCTELEGDVIINSGGISVDKINNLDGLSMVTSIEGWLGLWNNSELVTLSGLDNLNYIGGSLMIGHYFNGSNGALTSLNGLNSLTSIGGNLEIWENPVLEGLTELNNLTSVGGSITIGSFYSWSGNNSLLSLSGLDNITAGSITNLWIQNNISLSNCDVLSICNYLAAPNGTINIGNNAPGCNSQEEVEEACLTSVKDFSIGDKISIFPNPGIDLLTISTPKGVTIDDAIIYNQTGQKVLQGNPVNNTLDISKLQHGMYIIELETEQGTIRKKLIIE